MGRRGGLVNRAGDRLRPARSRETQTAHQRLGIAHTNRDRRCSARQRRVSQQRHRCTASHLTPDRANPPHPRLHQTWTELAGTTRPGNSTPHLSCAQCDLAAIEAVERHPTTAKIAADKQRIEARRGKNIAKVAAARKLLTLVYYGLRDGHIRALDRTRAA